MQGRGAGSNKGGCKNKMKRDWALNSSWGAGLGLRNRSGLDWVGSRMGLCHGQHI